MDTAFTVSTLTAVLGRLLPEPQAGLLAGILFGTRASLDKSLTDAFVTTGTIHMIALSGQNVSIVAGLVAGTLALFVSRRNASLLTLLVLGLFLGFVGPSPSLVRAVIMGSLTLLAIVFGKRYWSLLSLALAVTIMLVLRPLWIGDLGFQLSVLATLGIILFGGSSRDYPSLIRAPYRAIPVQVSDSPAKIATIRHGTYSRLIRLLSGHFLRFTLDDLRLTLSAQLFTTPLLLFQLHRISLVSPVTNILIGWTMPFLMMSGWVAAFAGYVWHPLGLLPAWVSCVLLTYVIRVVEMTARLPFASLAW